VSYLIVILPNNYEDSLKLNQHHVTDEKIVYLVEEQRNPSTDFFIMPVLSVNQPQQVRRCGFKDLPKAKELIGATVIFIRYIVPAWIKLIETVRPLLRELIIFIDDDVFNLHASAGMSLRYRFKLANLSARYCHWFKKQQATLWVSTPYLHQKYADWQPRLVLPSPINAPCQTVRVFYHGTASHNAEIQWLRPVIASALARNSNMAFEIVGGDDVYHLYRGLERVTVIHPMKWSAYQCFLNSEVRHIGLAPLLDTPFNRARSYAKFFGIHSCGAIGIYSQNGIFKEIIQHEVNGLLLPMETEAWVSAISRLITDKPLRENLLLNANETCSELITKAQNSYRDLLS
jgi:glycosyltransferase involved in cell wall biosynthesis